MTPPAVTLGVLGPVQAATPAGAVPLSPRLRAVLARLVIARGRTVPTDRLTADLWDDPADGAVGALRTFVSELRRALEPDRPARRPARLLVTNPPGYALHLPTGSVDAWRFDTAVADAARQLTAGQPDQALDTLDDALRLWRGPAYADVAANPWARAEIDRLDDLRLLATERRAEALLAIGRAAEVATDLRAHTDTHPLRENAWHLLATALYRCGRQADALTALRRARHTLATGHGLDPGPRLRQLETDLLTQAPHLDPRPADPPHRPAFVGRTGELAALHTAADHVTRHRRPAVALLTGDAGTGKTALAEHLTRTLTTRGWTTAWGRNPEYDGAPVAWPWTQITTALPGDPAPTGAGADPAVSRFRLHRAVAAHLTTAAAHTPVLVVLDDLHRADPGTLDLLTALATEPVDGPVLIIGTYRSTGTGDHLIAALARLAPAEPLRLHLDGLTETDTGHLARHLGADLDPAATRLLHERSRGNPFYARELARLSTTEGPAALHDVPPGVRDVIRHRLTHLPATARTLLQHAAVIGRDIDPDLLTALTGDEAATLDALDAALAAGFLTDTDTGRPLRFTHILVRDTLYHDQSALRRARRHAAVAAALEHLRPADVTALAHHHTHARHREAAARHSRAAAEQAEHRSHPHEAARLWQQALDAYEPGHPDRPHAAMGLGRTLAVTGHLDRARRLRADATGTAATLDDPHLAAAVVTAFAVPAVWTRNDDDHLASQVVQICENILGRLGDQPTALRSRLLSTLALELRGTPTGRGDHAARQAETIARHTGDPALLAHALNARYLHTFARTGLAPDRARLGAELAALAARHDLATYEVLGHLIGMQAHSALGDFTTAAHCAHAADRLATRYDLPLVGVLTDHFAALRLAAEHRTTDAEAAYRHAHRRLAGSGMPGLADGLPALTHLALHPDTPHTWQHTRFGPYEPWTRPLTLLAHGRPHDAAHALRTQPPSPHDLLREARLTLTGRAALALADPDTIARVHAELRPAAAELAGAGSGILTLGPVAAHLADLETALPRLSGHRNTPNRDAWQPKGHCSAT